MPRRIHGHRLAVGACAALVVLGCGSRTTVRSLPPEGGKPTLKIDCIAIDECWSAAREHCHGPYRALGTRKNAIAESDLPGLNARTQREGVSSNGPGIESDEPMPLVEVVVVCDAPG